MSSVLSIPAAQARPINFWLSVIFILKKRKFLIRSFFMMRRAATQPRQRRYFGEGLELDSGEGDNKNVIARREAPRRSYKMERRIFL